MTKDTAPVDPGLPFRPETEEHFKDNAKYLSWYLALPLQAAQECLSRVYGYEDLHELQAALAKPGKMSPSLLEWKRREAREQRTVEVVKRFIAERFSGIRNHEGRLEMLPRLGLFDDPEVSRSTHRTLKRLLGKRKGGDLAWPTPAMKKWLDDQFAHPFEFDASPLQPLKDFATGLGNSEPADPLEMLRVQRGYAEPHVYYLTAPVITDAHPDLPVEFDRGMFYDLYDLDAEKVEYLCGETFHEMLVEVWLPKYLGDKVEEFLSGLDEVEGEDWEEAALAPIPDGRKLRDQWFASVRYETAKWHITYSNPHEVIIEGIRCPVELASDKAESLCVAIKFGVSSGTEGHWNDVKDFQILQYTASFWIGSGNKRKPIGLMRGHYVVPFRNGYRVSPDNFHYFMDADSAALNDVWKVLVFDYFPSQGLESIDEYFEDRHGGAIATVNIELLPEYRGHRLTPHLLNLFSLAIKGHPYSAWTMRWAAPYADDEYEDDDESDFYVDRLGISLSEPSVFVFPIEGTRPERLELNPFDMLRGISSPAKVHVAKKDSKVEKQRESLAHYLKSIEKAVEGADIVFYNPWDYPIT